MKLWNYIVKKSFVFLLLSCFVLVACNNQDEKVKGDYDVKGNIVDINSSENRILVEDEQKGLTWVALHENGDIKEYEEGQEVVVWVDGGIDTSSPATTKALNIEIIKPEVEITKEFVEENAEIGLTYGEVRKVFGTEELADVVDNTETWLYDSTQNSEYEYNKSLESVAFEELKEGDIEYQLYINFVDEKTFMYSYFYLGEDGKVWQYQITPNSETLNNPVSK